jgi:hypothetical protein
MPTNKIKSAATLAFLCFALTISILGQDDKIERIESEKKCSSVIEGLQFCTLSPVISGKTGANVTVKVSLQNMTEKDISIIHGRFYDFYNTTVTKANGDLILSFEQITAKRYKDGTLSEKELIETLPINSSPRTIVLSPQQEYKVEFNFSYFYDFKSKGKYTIRMNRKIPKPNGTGNTELSFGDIEVEVK